MALLLPLAIAISEHLLADIVFHTATSKHKSLKKVFTNSLIQTSEYFLKKNGFKLDSFAFLSHMDEPRFFESSLFIATSTTDPIEYKNLLAIQFVKHGGLYFESEEEQRRVSNEIVNKFIEILSIEMLQDKYFMGFFLFKILKSISENINDNSNKYVDLNAKLDLIYEKILPWEYSTKPLLSNDLTLLANWTKYSKDRFHQLAFDELNGYNFYHQKTKELDDLYIKFINSDSWVTLLKMKMLSIPSFEIPNEYLTIKQFIQQIRNVELETSLEAIQNTFFELFRRNEIFDKIEEIIQKYKRNNDNSNVHNYISLKKALWAIRESALNQAFNKIFLITGSTGSGKTHFISTLFSDNKYNVLPLYISIRETIFGIEDSIFKESERATGLAVQSFSQLQEVLNSNSFSGYKFLLIIDDIEYASDYDSDLLNQITQLVRKYSNFHNVLWLMSLNYNFLDIIERNDKYLKKYYFDTKIERAENDICYYDNWINLDIINRRENIGYKIILSQINEKFNFNNSELPIKEVLKTIPSNMNPLLAWIFYETWDEDGTHQYSDYTYFDTIKRIQLFIECRFFSKLVTFEIVKDCISIISQLIFQNGFFNVTQYQLVNEISKLSIGKSELEERKIVEKVVGQLLILNLLIRGNVKDNSKGRIELNTIIYWQYVVAFQIMQRAERIDVKTFINSLSHFINFLHFRFYIEGLCEFLIILLDNENRMKIDEQLNELFSTILQCKNFPKASFWFSAIKLRNESQSVITRMISSTRGVCFDNRHDLFALINYIGNSTDKKYRLRKRLSDLHKLHAYIAEFNLRDIYIYVVKVSIGNVSSLNELFHLIPKFNKSEKLVSSELLADMIMTKAFSLSDSINKINSELENHLKFDIIEVKSKLGDNIDRNKGWMRYYFREWLLYSFSHHVAESEKLGAYLFFKQSGWYSDNDSHLKKHIKHEMEREANIAMGWLFYHSLVNKSDFLTFLDTLISSDDEIDQTNCFHIIRHTVVTRGSNKVRIDDCFHEYLYKIYHHLKFKTINEGFKDLFIENGIIGHTVLKKTMDI